MRKSETRSGPACSRVVPAPQPLRFPVRSVCGARQKPSPHRLFQVRFLLSLLRFARFGTAFASPAQRQTSQEGKTTRARVGAREREREGIADRKTVIARGKRSECGAVFERTVALRFVHMLRARDSLVVRESWWNHTRCVTLPF